MRAPYCLLLAACLIPCLLSAQDNPSFEEVISLNRVNDAVISPDGQQVVMTVRSADWKENRYDTELWLSRNGRSPFPLTHNPSGSSTGPKWSPDGEWIAFLSDRGDQTQIYVLSAQGGEALPLTHCPAGVTRFEWSPDGRQIAFLQNEEQSERLKKREELYGKFAADDSELTHHKLMLLDFEPNSLGRMLLPSQLNDSAFKASAEPRALLDSLDFYINTFRWSPDGKRIALEHQPNSLLLSFLKSDISLYEPESDKLTPVVTNPTSDGLLEWSPSGDEILFGSTVADSSSSFYKNDRYFRVSARGGEPVELAAEFDENLSFTSWSPDGLYALGWQKTHRMAFRVNPADGRVTPIHNDHRRILDATYSRDGKRMAYIIQENDGLPEVYLSDSRLRKPKKLTDFTTQIEDWAYADSDVICWQSKDGTRIEGVLSKPQDYDPEKKYPLLVIIHGGPTGISVPRPTDAYVYPMLQWLNKGALVLMPNYRGSAGYGEEFRSLNVRNLGVGDAWDVLSGVEYLVDQGMVDADKVGCMGWSQGGYISAFLTTHSDVFRAVSVGAGISNWTTYYVNTDIHPFTRQYLKATPWSDPEIYALTSPMTRINQAQTPTLIQHGEFDKRVPVPNAYELYQGLQDVGVESELYIYKGFGHGINKPKERLAATWHNWQWFLKYIWGEEVELPGLE